MQEFKSFFKEVQAEYKITSDKDSKNKLHNVKISCSDDAVTLLRKIYPIDITYREAFVCLFLNKRNNTVGHAIISLGGINGTVIDNKIIFQHALLCNASCIILSHNHPSGEIGPSEADKFLTKKIKKAGEIMDIKVLDHIILGETNYYSFADEGLL